MNCHDAGSPGSISQGIALEQHLKVRQRSIHEPVRVETLASESSIEHEDIVCWFTGPGEAGNKLIYRGHAYNEGMADFLCRRRAQYCA
jgi:hypothetical protein